MSYVLKKPLEPDLEKRLLELFPDRPALGSDEYTSQVRDFMDDLCNDGYVSWSAPVTTIDDIFRELDPRCQ